MSTPAWIVQGLIAGFIGSKTVNKSGEDIELNMLLGVVSAVVGEWLLNRVGALVVTGVNLESQLVAIIGSLILLVVCHAIRRMA